jgi:Tol biopolymer transport system component
MHPKNNKIRSSLIVLAFALVSMTVNPWAGAQGPDGWIAFTGYDGTYWQVFVIRPDGKDLKQVTRSPDDKIHVSWSRAADQLLVNTNRGELTLVDVATTQERPVDIGVRGMTDAVWSYDGQHVLFSLSIANSIDANDIWLVAIASGARRKLTHMPHMQHDPVWTHDERGVIFLSGAGGQGHDLWHLDLKTHSTTQLTVGQLYHFEPACSVNDEIAFSSNRSGDYEIWVCDMAGRSFEQITHSPGLDAQPAWSPDGRQLAFVSNRDGTPAIWVTSRKGPKPKQITPAGMICRIPAWQR